MPFVDTNNLLTTKQYHFDIKFQCLKAMTITLWVAPSLGVDRIFNSSLEVFLTKGLLLM